MEDFDRCVLLAMRNIATGPTYSINGIEVRVVAPTDEWCVYALIIEQMGNIDQEFDTLLRRLHAVTEAVTRLVAQGILYRHGQQAGAYLVPVHD